MQKKMIRIAVISSVSLESGKRLTIYFVDSIEIKDNSYVSGYVDGDTFYIDKFKCEDVVCFTCGVLMAAFKWAEEKGCNKTVFLPK